MKKFKLFSLLIGILVIVSIAFYLYQYIFTAADVYHEQGVINGRILSNSQAVEQAKIEAKLVSANKNNQTKTHQAISGQEGTFGLILSPGKYNLYVSGAQSEKIIPGVEVLANQTKTLEILLD